jgi:hypothetical protein
VNKKKKNFNLFLFSKAPSSVIIANRKKFLRVRKRESSQRQTNRLGEFNKHSENLSRRFVFMTMDEGKVDKDKYRER